MKDIRTKFDLEKLRGDWAVKETGLDRDKTLLTMAILSLFTHGRANPDDLLPDGNSRRGWFGEGLRTDGLKIGSRLWLLYREKSTAETLTRAIEYASEAMQGMVERGYAGSVSVSGEYQKSVNANDILALHIKINKPDGKKISFEASRLWGEL